MQFSVGSSNTANSADTVVAEKNRQKERKEGVRRRKNKDCNRAELLRILKQQLSLHQIDIYTGRASPAYLS